MKTFFEVLPVYIIIMSAISVIVCVLDKHRAKSNGWRVRERTLFILSLLGGSAAMYLTMKTIRHKTLHKRFMIGIPLITAAQIAGLAVLYFRTF